LQAYFRGTRAMGQFEHADHRREGANAQYIEAARAIH
jgi:hypothetical protein